MGFRTGQQGPNPYSKDADDDDEKRYLVTQHYISDLSLKGSFITA